MSKYNDLKDLVELANKYGLKAVRLDDVAIEFFDKPKPVINVPPPKFEDLIKQDEMPSDDELQYLSSAHWDEIQAQKEEGLKPPTE